MGLLLQRGRAAARRGDAVGKRTVDESIDVVVQSVQPETKGESSRDLRRKCELRLCKLLGDEPVEQREDGDEERCDNAIDQRPADDEVDVEHVVADDRVCDGNRHNAGQQKQRADERVGYAQWKP